MSIETNKAIVRRFFEQIMNQKRFDLVEEFLAESTNLYGVGQPIRGLPAIKEWYAGFGATFPDWRATIHDMVAEGDRVVIRYTSQATNLGPLQGLPATGKSVTQDAIVIYRLANGKIEEGWLQVDMLSFMQQLGLMPTPQPV